METLPDGEIVAALEAARGRGRNDYPVLPLLGDDPDRYGATLISNAVQRRLETASRDLVRRETSALRLYLRFLALARQRRSDEPNAGTPNPSADPPIMFP